MGNRERAVLVSALKIKDSISALSVARAASKYWCRAITAKLFSAVFCAVILLSVGMPEANGAAPTTGWWKANVPLTVWWFSSRAEACTDAAAVFDRTQQPSAPAGFSRGDLDDRELGWGQRWCYIRAPYQPINGFYEAVWAITSGSRCPDGSAPDTSKPTAKQCAIGNVTTIPVGQYDSSCPVGNPIYPGTGIKILTEQDFIDTSANSLSFKRTYRSNYQMLPRGGFGGLWQHQWQKRLDLSNLSASSPDITALRSDGTIIRFAGQGNGWVADGNKYGSLQAVLNGSGAVTGWRLLETSSDITETYDADGKLLSIQERNGWTTTLSYSDASTPASIAPHGALLIKVQNNFGRTLYLTYDPAGRISKMIAPDGAITQYSYDANGMLNSVIWPDGKTRLYHYEDNRFLAALTGITDEAGGRFAIYTYDDQGRAISSEHAGGAGKVQVQYLSQNQSVVTSADGSSRTYSLELAGKVLRPTSVSAPCAECGNVAKTTGYDASGNVSSRVDFDNQETRYTYDTQGRELQRIEDYGTADAKTTTTEWHPTWSLPIKIATPGRVDYFTYDNKGQLTTHGSFPTADANGSQGLNVAPFGAVSSNSYGYNGNGQMTTLSEQLNSSVTRQWTFGYDAQGNLTSAADGTGRTSRAVQYDPSGRLLEAIDLEGVTVKYVYDRRGRVLRYLYGDNVTAYVYDAIGQKIQVTSPNGDVTNYTYDAAHRLIDVLFNGQALTGPDPDEQQLALGKTSPENAGANPFSAWMGWISKLFNWLFGSAHAQAAPAPAVALGASVSIPGTYTPNPWDVLAPDAGGKKPWEWLAIWTTRLIDGCTGPSKKQMHRGRIQAQGPGYRDPGVGDVERWGPQPQSPTVADGLAMLDALQGRMDKTQLKDRDEALLKARGYVVRAGAVGGIGPPGKSFQNRAIQQEGGKERVDIEIIEGIAFVP